MEEGDFLLRRTFGVERMYSGRGGGTGGSNDMGSGPKPVAVGDELDVTVEAMAARGDGIAKKDGFVIFIKGVSQGQAVRIRITDVRQRYAVGQLAGGASGGSEAPTTDAAPAELDVGA